MFSQAVPSAHEAHNENPRPSIPRQGRHDRRTQTSFTNHERRARDAFQQQPRWRELPTVRALKYASCGARCLSIFHVSVFHSTRTTWIAAVNNTSTQPGLAEYTNHFLHPCCRRFMPMRLGRAVKMCSDVAVLCAAVSSMFFLLFHFHFFTLWLEFNDRSIFDISTRTLLIFTSRRV